jgi:hypothetical protein
MFGILAAVAFGIAFVINATSTSTNAVLTPTSLMLLGLTLLAVHLLGYGASWRPPRSRKRTLRR